MRAHFDCESYSPVDLSAAGVFVYGEHPGTEVLVARWSIDDGPVQTWWWGDPPPVLPDGVEWWAYNAQFDSTLWYYVLHLRCGWPWPGWGAFRCSKASAAYGNLPGKLAEVAKALGTSEKDDAGHKLMKVLCRPAAETTQSDDPKRRHTVENLARLGSYCAQDVVAERALHAKLPRLPDSETRLWQLDQTINRRGVYVDLGLVQRMKRLAQGLQELAREELAEVTGGAVTSETKLAALAAFCRAHGLQVPTGAGAMDVDAITAYLGKPDLDPACRRALEIRQELGRSSLAKLKRLEGMRCKDGRFRGGLEYYGAHQTGRWAGRGPQPQNFPRGVFEKAHEYEDALTWLRLADESNCPELLHFVYGRKALPVLTTMLRPCFRAAPGQVLVVVDFSAIEARGLAWASGEEWRLEVFRGNGKIYEASAARTLGVPVESIKKGSKERGLGKLTELALGYQGWVNALINFGALTIYKLREEDLKPLVLGWREASPAIPALWRGLESAAVQAIQNPGMVTRYRCAAFKMIDGHLRMALPSGRNLWYRNARVDMEPSRYREGVLEPKIYFWGENEDGFWGEQSAYGGSITNNLVQGLCRDVMAEAMLRAEEQGFPLVLTVHDELVAEVDDPGTAPGRQALVDRLEEIMCQTPAWANGMPITADGWCGPYYHKE